MSALGSLETMQKTVQRIAFTGDARLLITLGADNGVMVTEWANKRVLACEKADPAVCYGLATTFNSNALSIVAVGDKFLRVWNLTGRNMVANKISVTGKKGVKGSLQRFLCITKYENWFAIGCEDGSIYFVMQDDGSEPDKKVPRAMVQMYCFGLSAAHWAVFTLVLIRILTPTILPYRS
jgi:hypothetical protein